MRFVRTAENIFGLPAGFQRTEYLQSTGTQYIDTGYKPVPATTKFEFMFQCDDVTDNTFMFGARPDTSAASQYTCTTYKATSRIRQDWAGLSDFFTGITTTDKYLYTAYNNTITLNDTTVTGTIARSTTRSDYNFLLFTVNTGGTVDSRMYVGKVYYAKLWDNGVLVRDFIPCIDPLGVACMYDLVGKKPYYNQGTGTFTAGRKVIPVEYLESTGTQYIDTGVGGDLTTELTCEAAIVQAGNASVTNIMGNNVTSTRAITINMSANITNPSPSRIRFGNTDNTTEAGAIDLNTFYKYDTNKNELTVRDVGGTILNTYPLNATTAFTTNGNILIYKLGDTSTQYIGKVKVKGATIKNSGVLVRDFIPCKDENNVGFMFDKVSGTCYLNAGTGAFSVGENKHTSKLRLIKDARIPDGYTRVEYLESTGTQYINTGYIPTNTTGVQVRHTICANNGTDNILFGCRQTSGNNRFWEDVDWGGADNIGWGFNEYSNNLSGYRCPLTSDMIGQTVISSFNFMNDRACKVNGVSYDPSVATKTLATITRPIYLFAANNQGNAGYFNACKIFKAQISEGSTLVCSFIPVRDENNVGYMFDEVTGQLFGNAGSGSFGIGNDLSTPKVRFIQDVLPREYRPLKYLESSGTQFILTGFTPTVNTDFELELSSTKTSTNWAIGCPTWVGVHYKGADGQIGVTNSSTSDFQQYVNYARDNTRITMKLSGDTVYANGVSLGTITRRAGTLDFALFGYRDANRGATLLFTGSIYKCIIWDNGVPVRDLYPALRKSDNKPGMYDRITKQFFTNQGTGEFNYG